MIRIRQKFIDDRVDLQQIKSISDKVANLIRNLMIFDDKRILLGINSMFGFEGSPDYIRFMDEENQYLKKEMSKLFEDTNLNHKKKKSSTIENDEINIVNLEFDSSR